VAGKFEHVVRLRVRIRFSKQGDLRLIGHRDLMRCLERLFRRAGLTLSFSEGFHPKPRMTFPLALAVGIEGVEEVMEIELAESCTAEDLLRRLAPHAPSGLVFRKIEVLPDGAKKAQVRSASYEAPVPAMCHAALSERIGHLLAASSWPIERARGRAPIDLRPLVSELALREGVLTMRLRVDSRGSVGPRDVLAALGFSDLERQGVRLRRCGVEVCA
jgi:radical SAM-linked protein